MKKLTIQIAVAENKVTKVINSYGKKATYNNGGFRCGFVIEGKEFAAINKNAAYSGEADCWAVLKATEYAITQGATELTIIGHHATASKRGKDRFFKDLAAAKAMVANLTVEFDSDGDNSAAQSTARSSTATWLPFAPEPDAATKANIDAALKSIQTERGDRAPEKLAGKPEELAVPETVEAAAELKD